MSEFSINEEIIRQSLEVKFRIKNDGKWFNRDEWFICFSNPTAGPWKKIWFLDERNNKKVAGGYEKEETRPDLIIFSRKYKILLIIEAKDFMNALLASSVKIKETFIKTETKLSKLPLLKNEIKELSICYGLVFYSESLETDYSKVNRIYSSCKNLVVFIVSKDNTDNLIIKLKTNGRIKPLQEIFIS